MEISYIEKIWKPYFDKLDYSIWDRGFAESAQVLDNVVGLQNKF